MKSVLIEPLEARIAPATLSIAPNSILEGDSGTKILSFTVTLDEAATEAVTVNFTTANGTASAGSDYVAQNGTLSFAAGETSKTIQVVINGDLSGEEDETFSVQLSDPVNAELGTAQGTGTILNDAKLSISAPQPVTEGGSGDRDMVFTVTLVEGNSSTVTVNYAVQDGLAPNGATGSGDFADYSITPATGTLTFTSGQTTKTVTVKVKGDAFFETDETLQVQLSGAEHATIVSGQDTAVGTILNDDDITISNVTITEGDSGSAKALFTVRLLTQIPTDQKLVIKYKTVDGTARSTGSIQDFVAVPDGVLEFTEGESVKTIAIDITGDRSYEEALEQFKLQLLSAQFQHDTEGENDGENIGPEVTFAPGTKEGTATIKDNDALPTISISDTVVLEGNTPGERVAKFTITLSERSDFPVEVKYSTINGTAIAGDDFTGANALTVTIPAGSQSIDIEIPIIGDTNPNEGNETFRVKLLNDAQNFPQLKTSATEGKKLAVTRDEATGTIVNDEVRGILEPVTSTSILEGDSGVKELTFNVKLIGTATQAVTVNLSTLDGTAISSGIYADFQSLTESLTFQPGETSKTITIKINGDTRIEGNENFKLVLTANDVELGGTDGRLEQTITIQDEAAEPVPTVTLTIDSQDGKVVEGGQTVFRVTLSQPSNQAIEIPYSIIDGTAKSGSAGNDYTNGENLKIIIPAGQTTATFTVNTTNDALSENEETFSVELGEVTNATVAEGGGTVTAKIVDNDISPTLSISNAVRVEGNNGETEMVFTVSLSAVAGRDITVKASTFDGTATAGSDYISLNDFLVTIPAGQQSATFSVKINGDTAIENDETFFVRLNAPTNATLVVDQATGTIQNDESQFEILFKDSNGEYTLTNLVLNEEGVNDAQQEISFIIRRTGDLSQVAQVRYETANGVDRMEGSTKIRGAVGSGPRADFTFATDVLEFAAVPGAAAGSVQDSAPVTIKISKDTAYEGLEEFKVQLTEAINAATKQGDNLGRIQITDNETVPTITVTNATVLDGNFVTNPFTGEPERQRSSLVFKVKLSHVDETGTVSMLFNTQDDSTAGAYKATGATSASGAGAKDDYVKLSSTSLSFAPGETEKNITVTVLGDIRDEYDETLQLVLSNLQGGSATFGTDAENQPRTSLTAIGTITDDDAEAVINITDLVQRRTTNGQPAVDSSGKPIYDPVQFTESDGTSSTKFFLVTLSGETDKVVTVKYSTRSSADEDPNENVYAIAGEDFTGVIDGTITFDPNNSDTVARTVQQIRIGVINDTIVEGDQSFEVLLTQANGGLLNNKRGVGVILDDKSDDPQVAIGDVRLIEGDNPFSTQTVFFSVALTAKAQRDVTIRFDTEDGTGKASGLFADYIAESGLITFAAGETSKDIPIQVINDIYKEANDETFKLRLSGLETNNADLRFLGTGVGTATIENGTDTIVGVGINDVKLVEGGRAQFNVEISVAQESNVSFNMKGRNGTALKDSDFVSSPVSGTTAGVVTITAGQTSAIYQEFTTTGDNNFEATEHFFVDLSGAGTGMEVVKETARAEIYNDDVRQIDARTVQWIDLDGDLVTLKVSKGTLDGNNIGWVLNNDGSVFINSNGGRALQVLDVNSTEFQKANITITSERQPGFTGDANGNFGDGRVNVGFIRAGVTSGDGITFYGIDLGTVKVDGDLGRIDVGDNLVNGLSLKKLDVFSLGVHPESTDLYFRDESGNITGSNTASFVQGAVGAINVRSDFAGKLTVTGAEFGDINSLNIGGALRGLDNFNQTGTISFTGTLKKAVIGQILGGVGSLSGRIEGDTQQVGNIQSITVQGDVAGNSGAGSGVIAASSIGKVKIGRLLGGGGDDSGQIRARQLSNVSVSEDVVGFIGARSGAIISDSSFGSRTGVGIGIVKIGGRLIGGSGAQSGILSSDGGFAGVAVFGNVPTGDDALLPEFTAAVNGGVGTQSGKIVSAGGIGTLVLGHASNQGSQDLPAISLRGGVGVGSGVIDAGGAIKTAKLYGGIYGGDAAQTGVLAAASLNNALILGSVVGSPASTSGVITVGGAIGSLIINGDLKGGDSQSATDSTGAFAVETTGSILAGRINKLLITGDVVAGEDLGSGLSGSGSIAANGPIKEMVIQGSIKGQEDVPVRIFAFGNEKEAAIGSLHIGGRDGAVVQFAEITAGVSLRPIQGSFPVNADAKIGTVRIDADVKGLNITAGANRGPDGIFATADDQVLNNPGLEIDNPKIYSSIARVIINGQIEEVPGETEGAKAPFGIVAQHIGEILFATDVPNKFAKVDLQNGPGNDTATGPDDEMPGKAINGLNSFRAIELPIA